MTERSIKITRKKKRKPWPGVAIARSSRTAKSMAVETNSGLCWAETNYQQYSLISGKKNINVQKGNNCVILFLNQDQFDMEAKAQDFHSIVQYKKWK